MKKVKHSSNNEPKYMFAILNTALKKKKWDCSMASFQQIHSRHARCSQKEQRSEDILRI